MTQANVFDSDQQWFAYFDCNFETFKTEAEAIKWCEDWLDEERGGAWSEESMNITYGRIHGGCVVTEKRELTEEERGTFDDEIHGFEERKVVPFANAEARPVFIYQTENRPFVQANSEPCDGDIELVKCGPMMVIRVSETDGKLAADQMTREAEWEPVEEFNYFTDPDDGKKIHCQKEAYGPDADIHEDHIS